MVAEDIETDLNSYLCAIEMCKVDKDGHRCASLCSEMASLGLDLTAARPALLQLTATCQGMWREAVEAFEKLATEECVLPEMLHLLVQAASNDPASGSREVSAIAMAAWIDGCEVVAGTLELLVQTLSQQGHIDLALETLEEIHQHDQQTDASSLRSGLQISGISSAQSSSRVYAALLNGCVATQNTKGARNVIDAMRSHGVWDSAIAAISSCKGSSDSDIVTMLAPILASASNEGEE
jgi:pentatricopeptide repeat protein